MRIRCRILNLGVLYSRSGQKVGILDLFWYQVYQKKFSGIESFDELRQFVNLHVSIIFRLTVKYILQGLYCTFSKCTLSLTHCRVKLFSFSFAQFFKLSSNFLSLVDPSVFGSIPFCNHSKNARTVSFKPFVFIPFACTVLSNRSWWTSRYFTPFLSLATFSTFAKSVDQISVLNLENAFCFMNLRVARVNFVYEGFEGENCRTFETDWLFALT